MARTLSQGVGAPTRQRLLASAMLGALVFGSACGRDPAPGDAPRTVSAEEFVWPSGPHPTVALEVEGHGTITIELYPELAPQTVENFLALAQQDFYDGTTFHRVVPGFMIQGGDPNSRDADPRNDGLGGPEHRIPDEHNAAPHVRGAVSMANTGQPDTGGSQFFIVQSDSTQLDGRFTLFGRVTRGMEIVDAISEVEVDEHGRWSKPGRPLENVVIADVSVVDAQARVETAEAADAPPTS